MGCGRVGATLATNLSQYGHSVAVIDRTPEAFRRLPEGFTGQRVTGTGFDRDALVHAGIEDAQGFAAVSSGDNSNILAARGVLPVDRIVGLETGGCPHTAIREDTSMNEAAIAELVERHPDLEVVFVESGGDNLSATFSPELVDFSIYVIDVAQGEKIPRKAGQGMIKSDLFVINKTDLAPHVGADLAVMEADSKVFRGDKPFCFTNLKTDEGLDKVLEWIRRDVLLMDLA